MNHGETHGSPVGPLLHTLPTYGFCSGCARAKPGSAHLAPTLGRRSND